MGASILFPSLNPGEKGGEGGATVPARVVLERMPGSESALPPPGLHVPKGQQRSEDGEREETGERETAPGLGDCAR